MTQRHSSLSALGRLRRAQASRYWARNASRARMARALTALADIAEDRGERARRVPLDGGVPKDALVPLGETAERGADEVGVEPFAQPVHIVESRLAEPLELRRPRLGRP